MEMQLVFFNLGYIRELLQLILGIILFFAQCVGVLAILALFWKAFDSILN